MLYGSKILDELCSESASTFKQATFIYGTSQIGKSWLMTHLLPSCDNFVQVIDCAKFNSHLSSVDSIRTLEEYLNLYYTRAINYGPSSVLVLDNFNALCP